MDGDGGKDDDAPMRDEYDGSELKLVLAAVAAEAKPLLTAPLDRQVRLAKEVRFEPGCEMYDPLARRHLVVGRRVVLSRSRTPCVIEAVHDTYVRVRYRRGSENLRHNCKPAELVVYEGNPCEDALTEPARLPSPRVCLSDALERGAEKEDQAEARRAQKAQAYASSEFGWQADYGTGVGKADADARRAAALGQGAKKAGCSLAEAHRAGLINSASDAAAAGYSASQARVAELIRSATDAKAAGYSAAAAKAAGFSASNAKSAGYSASDAVAAGLIRSAADAKAAGYSASEVDATNLVSEAKPAGFCIIRHRIMDHRRSHARESVRRRRC